MKLVTVGTGTAVADGRCQSCVLIDDRIAVDVGIGSLLRIGKLTNNLSAILLTHNHLDHNGDVLAILKSRWLSGIEERPKIIGPAGTINHIESLFESYPYLRKKLSFELMEVENEKFEVDGFEVEAIATKHSIKSTAYLIDSEVLISGDTRAMKEVVGRECKVLIHEMSLPFGFKAVDHTTPENFKEVLDSCTAEKILLTHIYPNAMEQIDTILEYLDDERIEVARDGDEFVV
ncbi:Metal-dependent hydrolases of the beta-lactamase superfamily III [Archaeoglobus sulfaticallidus PM70-1]|uniref:Metal-dependent hydrolases of the beta-lactamase superfamily III n=1 Tax=Archaeoglobus sulfaticallidus PM70-1 TaxID=387631 RepID=N0BFY2_9EURY|nr:MBL fold metallo-hydrolase [Archaeoglobus sulfaticallidus]AGK61933.1 Metal-dependent hydrolases of the beta-lactamase superfamily III [Archaeoglobus sulfaticallidus PM70-1]